MRNEGRPAGVWIAATRTPLRNQAEEIFGRMVVLSKITQSERVETALHLGKEAAENNNRAKSNLLAYMSHEIRTPMNGIMSMTELILDTPLTSGRREYPGRFKISVDSFMSVIKNILDSN